MENLIDGENRALRLYRQALDIDGEDFIVHYNMVLCYIIRNNQRSINQAIEELNIALGLLHQEIERLKLLQIQIDPPTDTNRSSSTDQASMAELVYLHYIQSVLTNSRDELCRYDEDKHEISCECKGWKEVLANLDQTEFKNIKNEMRAEYEEWLSEGLVRLYVFKIEAKRCWWKTIFVFVMGVAQMVGGVLACTAGHWKLGTSMFLQGAFDVYTAVGKGRKLLII